MLRYEKIIKDHNFGSLIRTDSEGEYSERNTIFGLSSCTFYFLFLTLHTVMRMQFYVFEIARNRLGLNDKAHEIAKEDARKEAEKKAERKAAKKAAKEAAAASA